jgi:hypothetical protein
MAYKNALEVNGIITSINKDTIELYLDDKKAFIVLQIKYNHYTPTIQVNDSVKVVYDIKSKCINSILVKNNKNL